MTTFYGADVEQLRQLGRSFESEASQVSDIISRVTSRTSAARWSGPDADRFRSEWRDQFAVVARKAVGALREAAARANANANEQDQASRAGSATTVGSSASTITSAVPGGSGSVSNAQNPSDLIWSSTRDALNQKLPGLGVTYGDMGALIPGVGTVLEVRDIADSMQQGHVPLNQLVDVAAGALRSTENPVAYGTGVALGLYNTVAVELGKTDFSAAPTAFAYMHDHPFDALNAAVDSTFSALPEIAKNFTFW